MPIIPEPASGSEAGPAHVEAAPATPLDGRQLDEGGSAGNSDTNTIPSSLPSSSPLSPSSSTTISLSSILPAPSATSSSRSYTILAASAASSSADTVGMVHHVPSPVAMIAGSLAGFIVILAAVVVMLVARRPVSGGGGRGSGINRSGGSRRVVVRRGEAFEGRGGYVVDDARISTKTPSSRTRESTKTKTKTKTSSTRGSVKKKYAARYGLSDDEDEEEDEGAIVNGGAETYIELDVRRTRKERRNRGRDSQAKRGGTADGPRAAHEAREDGNTSLPEPYHPQYTHHHHHHHTQSRDGGSSSSSSSRRPPPPPPPPPPLTPLEILVVPALDVKGPLGPPNILMHDPADLPPAYDTTR